MASKVPAAVLQAGIVIGDSSASFKMLRHLSERLPAAFGPKWIKNRITPIGIRDAIFFLISAADLPSGVNRTFDIGGPETVPYAELIQRYAKAQDLLPRAVFTAPVMTPRLGARWIGLVTPVSSTLATPLIGSLLHDTVVSERDFEAYYGRPTGGLMSFEASVNAAVQNVDTKRWPKVALSVTAAVVSCAIMGTAFSAPNSSWYKGLNKPRWQPPAIIFPLVWTTLYVDIAVVSSLVIADEDAESKHPQKGRYKAALAINLALNAGWCALFFRSHKPVLATLGAAALAVSSTDLVRRAYKSSPERGIILAPYALWTVGATFLSGAIAKLNRKN